jgi:uncharacterized protein (TIGR02246 family)
MLITSHQGRGWPVWVLLVALVAGCGWGETQAEPRPGQPNDGDQTPRSPEEGGVQQARELLQPPVEPQDWPRIFTERINAGDIEGAAALYEPDARFVTPSGETLVGREQMRRVLAGLIDAKTHMQCRVVKAVVTGDVAVLYTDFQRTTVEASGKTVEANQKAIEVLRHQPDGTWRLIVGDPHGRMR